MHKKPHLGRQLNNYFRVARWIVRGGVDGHWVATCEPKGLASVGVGKSRVDIDVSGDTIELDVVGDDNGASRSVARVAVTAYETWLLMFAFPLMVTYLADFSRKVKKVDPTLRIHYPWSLFRIVCWLLVVVLVVAMVL